MRRFWRNQDGATAVVTALTMTAAIGFVGLAVDVGNIYLNTRRLQGIADLAAISAASDLPRASQRADQSVAANAWPGRISAQTEAGTYTPNPDITIDERFEISASGRNAARVRLSADAPVYFAALFLPEARVSMTREAVAAQSEFASFSIGTRLLSLNEGVLNQLLSGLTGSNVSLSVMDYRSLASAEVDLFGYIDALRTRADIEAGSFDQALDARISPADALGAIDDVLDANRHRAAPIIERLANAAPRTESIDGLSQLFDLGPYGAQDVVLAGESARVRVNALDLATSVLELSNGERQVRLDVAANAPGLAQTRVWLAIGERPNNSPWLSVTEDNDVIVRTAQARIYAQTTIGSAVGGVRVPIFVEMASAEARLSDIECDATPQRRSVTLEVAPSLGTIALADIDVAQLNNFRRNVSLRPARLIDLALLRVEGEARVDLGGHAWQRVRFNGDEITRGVVKSVATRDLAEASIASLLGRTQLSVRPANINLGPVTAAVRPALTTAGATLSPVINGLTDVLGIALGEADVRVTGVRCGAAALVI